MNSSSRIISIIGLGYVGLPMAVEFSKKFKVIGFDINQTRIDALKKGEDATGEVDMPSLQRASILFTSNVADLKQANFYIVAVPTPITSAKEPDLFPLIKASESVGSQLKKDDIVVFESTVYPGATEEECVPVLEKYSGLKCGKDFFIGYSPERINPGDKTHTFTKIKKVVSGQNEAILEIIAEIYGSVIEAGVYKAQSIKVAEAAKVIENTQRDLNIALINELAIIFQKMGIDTQSVLEAAATKWNFLPFKPGLVGGHCIGVDPYYLTYKAKTIGLNPQVILAGRRTNDGMGEYIATHAIKLLAHAGKPIKGAKVGILGLTFKENCPDLRNTKVVDIYQELLSFGVTVKVHDPLASSLEAKEHYNIELAPLSQLTNLDLIILAVSHQEYLKLSEKEFAQMFASSRVIMDVKSILDQEAFASQQIKVWRL